MGSLKTKKRGLKGLGGAPIAETRHSNSSSSFDDDNDDDDGSENDSKLSTTTILVEERGAPLARLASCGFDAGARRVLPGNLLRRAAVLSALELAGGEPFQNRQRRTGKTRRVVVRTRVVASSGEEATLLWTVEREEGGEGEEEEEEDETNRGCWLVAAVDRDASGDFGDDLGDDGDFGPAALSSPSPLLASSPLPHPRLGPEQVVCAAALELSRGGNLVTRWMTTPPATAEEEGQEEEREREWERRRGEEVRRAAASVFGLSCSPPSAVVTVVASACPRPGACLVDTVTTTTTTTRRRREETGGKKPVPRPVAAVLLSWALELDECSGCWRIESVTVKS